MYWRDRGDIPLAFVYIHMCYIDKAPLNRTLLGSGALLAPRSIRLWLYIGNLLKILNIPSREPKIIYQLVFYPALIYKKVANNSL